VRGQGLKEPGDPWIHGAAEYVVLFSSAQDAGAFFTASAQRWPACAGRQYNVTLPGQPNHVVIVGQFSNMSGTLSAPQTFTANNGVGTCQRALTVASNVAIDVVTCFNNVPAESDSAVNIAHQIAAKVSAM
jgi:serine/threonine-protein kinase